MYKFSSFLLMVFVVGLNVVSGAVPQTRTVIVDMWDSYGDGWNGAALKISVNDVSRSPNLTISSGSSATYRFDIETSDVVKFYWVKGNNDAECAFAIYYSNALPSPTFSPVMSATIDKVNLLAYGFYTTMYSVSSGTLLGSIGLLGGNFRWYTDNPEAKSFSISTAGELDELAKIVNGTVTAIKKDDFSGDTVKLIADIDLSAYTSGEGWVPIDGFSGTFDGGGHIISNLIIDRPQKSEQGLFGSVSDGVVKNLGLERVSINGKDWGGILAANVTNSNVINCYSTGTIKGGSGLVGSVSGKSSVNNCYSTATVNGKGGIAGGVGGSSNITNCYSTGDVIGSLVVGGITGGVRGSSYVSSCVATGKVIAETYVGGIAGEVRGTKNCDGARCTITNSSLTNCAALNVEVSETDLRFSPCRGKVVGYCEAYSVNSNMTPTVNTNNVVFIGMLGNANNADQCGTVSTEITAAEVNADGTIGGRFSAANGWTIQAGRLPGLFGRTVPMPAHLSRPGSSAVSRDRVIPQLKPVEETLVITPSSALIGEFTAGPNPTSKSFGRVTFFRQDNRITSAKLSVYDASGNIVNMIAINDKVSGGQSRRPVGSWDLTDKRGYPVPMGTYLIKGVINSVGGKSEKVSVIVGVQ